MAEMGMYCKAYPAARFREFPSWSEMVPPLRLKEQNSSPEQAQEEAGSRSDGYFFLQENYTVTAGVFIDENIAFREVTDEWKDFCTRVLDFQIPPSDEVELAANAAQAGTERTKG